MNYNNVRRAEELSTPFLLAKENFFIKRGKMAYIID
ncbi:hypothetical protein J2X07_000516 [Fictibacillus barbaricus]|uniref:Uncharacterized protein n=1 Tax=Fictibacillus barbaricus TaxID=182136 RepID=A0ABU1TWH8_9BACL|nr:hypothetical protein [Fictibacillus barbaricus]